MEGFNSSSSLPFPFSYPIATTNTSCLTSSSFINPSSSPWMDSRLWSQLPQQLLDRVITFLPPPSFFKARKVCKRWYGLLYSTSFLKLYLHVSPSHHWFMFFNHKTSNSYTLRNKQTMSSTNSNNGVDSCEGYMFDPYTLTWYHLMFPLIPSCFSPVSSSGGLICFTSNDSGSKSLVLYNPLIGTLSQLPPTLRPRLFPSIGLSVKSSSLDIIVAGDDMISPYAVKNLTSESFHIDDKGFYSIWGTCSSLPRLSSLDQSSQVLHVDAKFYSMNHSPFSVLSYDVTSNTWCKIQAPMRRFLRSPSLLENQGRVMLIAAVEKSKLNVPKSLRMWCLQPCGRNWIELERMPLQLYIQFEEIECGRGFDCVGHGEFVMIMIKGCNKGLMFDFYLKRWSWIPTCPFSYGDDQLHGFAYEPKLVTPVTGLLDQLIIPNFQSFNV